MRRKISIRAAGTSRHASERIHRSTGNLFADLGFPDPGQHLAKAQLAHTICELINSAGLSQKTAAQRLGIDQPKVSALMRGKLRDFSTDRLMRFVIALDHDVVITIRQARDHAHPAVRVLAEA
jgi:predicted XRE-type DNA-binding protein